MAAATAFNKQQQTKTGTGAVLTASPHSLLLWSSIDNVNNLIEYNTVRGKTTSNAGQPVTQAHTAGKPPLPRRAVELVMQKKCWHKSVHPVYKTAHTLNVSEGACDMPNIQRAAPTMSCQCCTCAWPRL